MLNILYFAVKYLRNIRRSFEWFGQSNCRETEK